MVFLALAVVFFICIQFCRDLVLFCLFMAFRRCATVFEHSSFHHGFLILSEANPLVNLKCCFAALLSVSHILFCISDGSVVVTSGVSICCHFPQSNRGGIFHLGLATGKTGGLQFLNWTVSGRWSVPISGPTEDVSSGMRVLVPIHKSIVDV